MDAGADVTYTCANAEAYVQGTADDRTVTVQCPAATGAFPNNFGTCEVRCAVPAAEAGYANRTDQGALVVGGSSVAFTCEHAHGYVDGTASRDFSVECNPNTGAFPTGWDACVVKCSVPAPEAGYNAQVDLKLEATYVFPHLCRIFRPTLLRNSPSAPRSTSRAPTPTGTSPGPPTTSTTRWTA